MFEEIEKKETLSDRIKKHCNLILMVMIFMVLGIVFLFYANYSAAHQIYIALGISLMVGGLTGILGILFIGKRTGWIFSSVLSLFVGVYISSIFYDTGTVFYTSYLAPIFGALIGLWLGTDICKKCMDSLCVKF